MSPMSATEPATDPRRRFTTPLWAFLIVLLAGAIVGAALSNLWSSDKARPRVVQGVVTGVNEDGSSVAFTEDGGTRQGEALRVAADTWTDVDGNAFGGIPPTCMLPGSYGQRIELAIVELDGPGHWPSKIVVGVHCLS